MRVWMSALVMVVLGARGDERPSSAAALESTVRLLSGADPLDGAAITSRHVDHPDHDRAAAWLEEQLRGIDGLEVWRDSFDFGGREHANLVAHRAGTEAGAPVVIVGAHFDSIASRTDGWISTVDAAPGADDDASGVAAVLAIARGLTGDTLRHPVRFVLFDVEEEGLVGSTHHASHYDPGEIELVWSLDPIGHNPGSAGYLWVTWDARWPDPAESIVQRAADLDLPLVVQTVDASLIGGDQRSDHAPFWNAGHPALHLASFPQPPDYHKITDTIDGVDPSFISDVTELMIASVRDVAGEVEPHSGGNDAVRGCGS